jgi:hypothetical protein
MSSMNPAQKAGKQRRMEMNDLLSLLIMVAVWFFVQWWLLPKMGVST